MAERICAKFTVKTCFVTRSFEFERQGQGLKVKHPRQKTHLALLTSSAAYEWYVLAAAEDNTIRSLPGVISRALSAAYV